MESWDDDNFEPKVTAAAAGGNKWVGEDEDDDVKESWEDEDEKLEEDKKDDVPAAPKTKKKTLAEKIAEKERQRELELERKMKEQEEEDVSQEEKMRRQKESDLNIALETTFGGSNSSGLDSMCPTTLEEFDEFGDAFLKKIRPLTVNLTEFALFAENLIRNLCAPLTSNDLKKIKTTLDNLVLEKQKIEKGDKSKKNKGKGKAKLKLDNENQFSAYVDDYDEFDDFM